LPESDVLHVWHPRTDGFRDGRYDLEVRVTDQLKLTGTAATRIAVDNEAPPDSLTSPVRIGPGGGEIFSDSALVHLVIESGALEHEAVVSLDTIRVTTLPTSGRLLRACRIGSAGDRIQGGGAILDIAIPSGITHGSLSIEQLVGSTWSHRGGTLNRGETRMSIALPDSGTFGVVDLGAAPSLAGDAAPLDVVPRMFRPGLAGNDVAITFGLIRPGPVDIAIYNRAGRRVRSVMEGLWLGAGQNVAKWDGRTESGRLASDGIYLVDVRGPSFRATGTLLVAH